MVKRPSERESVRATSRPVESKRTTKPRPTGAPLSVSSTVPLTVWDDAGAAATAVSAARRVAMAERAFIQTHGSGIVCLLVPGPTSGVPIESITDGDREEVGCQILIDD